MSVARSPGCLKVALLTTDNRWIFKDVDNPAPHFGTAPTALIEALGSLTEVALHIVSCTRQPVAAPEKLGRNVWFHSLHVPKLGWIRTGYQGCIRAVRKKLRRIQPDIVHGQGTESDCGLEAIFSGFPNVLTIHGNMRRIAQVEKVRPFSHPWFTARFESFTIPRSLGVVCITRHTQAEVAGLARRTWVVPNAVETSFFEVNAKPSPEEAPRILCVGRVCPLKNQNAFIQSLDCLAAKRKFELICLGNAGETDAYGQAFRQLVRERSWCKHLGFAGREELRRILANAALLALPSLEENCPMVVLEAMAAGVPVVAARVGGVPDLIEEGKTGRFCDPQDPASMRGAVESMLADASAARAMATLAQERAKERFHPAVVARRHLEIYQEVLGRPSHIRNDAGSTTNAHE